MKVLLNTTTLHKGGALQTSSAFIMQALAHQDGIAWVFALSRTVASELAQFGTTPPGATIVLDELPSHSRAARRQLAALEDEVRPDCVFTFSGPAYVRFRSFHIMGCSNPWVTHSSLSAYRSLFPRGWLDNIGRNLYRAYWFTKADAWIVQTETARLGLARRLRRPLTRIAVISNTCGDQYLSEQGRRPFPRPGQTLRLLSFAAPYRQKNLDLLPHLAREIERQRPGLDFKFLITLPPDHYVCREVMPMAARLGVEQRIENIGPVPVARGPELYRSCDICFLPTLLETFSANYPEAMAMGLPIVTTDLGFAHDVCGDAALYFAPRDARAAAAAVFRLVDDQRLWERQIERGKQVLTRFPTPEERYRAYIGQILALAGGRESAQTAVS
jgi:glycosyltransferase involved in cell wall biosynthesis